MPLYIDVYQSEKTSPHKDQVLEMMSDVYSDGHSITSLLDLVTLCKLMCGSHKQGIRGLTIAGHGTSISFRVGRDIVTANSLDPRTALPEKRHHYPYFLSIRGLFDPGAWVRIDACQCGADETLLRRLSQILGVAVFAWSGDQMYTQIGSDISVARQGNQVVCVSARCLSAY